MAKKNTKRGFTLVELIVVLVILAILAALLIPALTGYIDKARKSQVVAETRMLTQAVQTEMSTLYASNEYATQLNAITKAFTAAAKDGKPVYEHEQKLPNLADRYNAIVNLSEVPSLAKGTGSFFAVTNYNCQLKWVVYKDGKGYYGVYCQANGSVSAYSKKELTTVAEENTEEQPVNPRKGYYPDDIAGTFGMPVEQHRQESELRQMDGFVSVGMLTGMPGQQQNL